MGRRRTSFYKRRLGWIGVGIVMAASLTVLSVSLLARAEDQGCIRVQSARELASFGARVSTGTRFITSNEAPNIIDSVIGSSSERGRLYVTTADRRLYRGSGTPVHWERSPSLVPGRLVAALETPGETLFAAEQALYRSDDRGASWRRLSCGLVLNDVAISRERPNTIYLAADAGEGETRILGGLYRTNDGGRRWERITRFPKTEPEEPIVRAVAVDPRSPDTVFLGARAGGVLRSIDGGRHSQFSPVGPAPLGLDGPMILSLAFGGGAQPLVWAGSTEGVFRADADGRKWSPAGLTGLSVKVVPDPRKREVAFARSDSGYYRTIDRGMHWRLIQGLPLGGLSVVRADGSVYAWGERSIFRSRDHGRTWTRLPDLPKPGRP
jgi:hypothetical protein